MPNIPKVLIVDDDLRMCESLAALLKHQNYELKTCSSGRNAVDCLNKDVFDLVLLDMVIPDMDGYQIMDHINEQRLNTLVIVITGNVSTESAIGALRRGAYDYIRKPFEPEELLLTVKNGLDHRRLKRENDVVNNKLVLSENRYKFLVQNSPDIIYTLDNQGNFTFVSNAVERLLNYTIEQLVGKHYSIIVHEADLEKARWFFAERRTGDRAASGIELRLKVRNGNGRFKHSEAKHLIIELKSNGIYDRPATEKDKAFLGTHGVARDINVRKQLENQLHHAQRMEALGTLAGGISHDFNNLLMGIQGRASLMLMDIDSSHPHFEHLVGIEAYVKSAADLTKQLLGLARGGKYEVKPTDLNNLIKKTSRMFGRTRKEIRIRGKYEQNRFVSEVDEGQMELVLLNLFVNAWQAMPEGGELYLETENVLLDDGFVKPYGLEPGKYAKISVTDTGIGMDKATRERIFDPFFTTKETGRGTGLGLASAYGIIKNHGGIINVHSEKGQGATFNIFLPATEKEVAKEKELTVAIVKGKETILLVDDEDLVIDVSKDLLKKMGYKVLIAKSGQAAVELYEANKDEIDLVILDMIMPDMGGSDTFDRLKEINPPIKVLLASGYSVDGQATKILERGCNSFIQKPFKMMDLSKKIREILDKV
ncbi:MAG: response regulator [Pseudomonadota bacterium]